MIINFRLNKIYSFEEVLKNVEKAQKLYFEGRFKEAYPIITDAAKSFDSYAFLGLSDFNLNKNQYKAVYMLAGDICGELGYFEEALLYYKKHQFFNLQINHDFRDAERVTLFQFRSTRQYTLNNLRLNQITLVDPRIQNDIVDTPVFLWLETLCGNNTRHKRHIDAFKASFDYLRSTSFCLDSSCCKAVENTLMWAHYANCHKGICVQYELGTEDFATNKTSHAFLLRLMKIKYIDSMRDVIDFTNTDMKLDLRTGLATKSNE